MRAKRALTTKSEPEDRNQNASNKSSLKNLAKGVAFLTLMLTNPSAAHGVEMNGIAPAPIAFQQKTGLIARNILHQMAPSPSPATETQR